MTGQDMEHRQIERAVTTWARSVFAAPRQLHRLVTNIENRDELVVRVATSVVRRELREVRSMTRERRSTRPRVARDAVDPFVHTEQTLKADSEHVTQCGSCSASGLVRCDDCAGTGIGRCPACHGSGKERSAKTGRPIRCKSCKATGSAPCRPCGGQASIPCRGCLGSGHQLAWLTLGETQRCELVLPEASPVVIAHRWLGEHRALAERDVAGMTIMVCHAADGPLDTARLAPCDREVVGAQLRQIDPRFERVVHQQYLKLAVLRRDVTFEMCGTRAILSLSGTSLAGATTPETLRPIRRRLYSWAALCVLVAVAAGLLRGAVLGTSRYFDEPRATVAALGAAAVVCAIPTFGTVLRSWRGGLRFHAMRWPTIAWSAGAIVALASILLVGVAARPAAAEVTEALAHGDLEQARTVIDALRERAGEARHVLDLEDGVLLADAAKRQGRDRLALLDAVAAHGGAAARSAAVEASSQRLDDVRALIATAHPGEALAELARSFPDDRSGVVAEERARAHEAAQAACTISACQLDEALQAGAARPTPARTAAIDRARAQLLKTLDLDQAHVAELVVRLQWLQQLADSAAATRKVAVDDHLLQQRASAASDYAEAQRRAVPLLGNRVAVAEQLLGASSKSPNGGPMFVLDGVTVYLAVDKQDRCTGLYAVGGAAGHRALASPTWTAERLLSQALGKPSAIPAVAKGQVVSRWFVAGVPVVARWEYGAIVELRVGDAAP